MKRARKPATGQPDEAWFGRDEIKMSVKALFETGADKYDEQRRKVIPCFDEFYKTAVDLIPFGQEETFRFLDLGAGTGLLTALILAKFPNALPTLIDISEKMLTKARERFEKEKHVSFCTMDYAVSPLPGKYDLVVSAMSVHHLADSGKKRLFRSIYEGLVPGGHFIHADLVKGATGSTETRYQRRWAEHLEQADLTEDQLSLIYERMSYDKTAPLEDQLRWLRGARFEDVDCFYKHYNFAVYGGSKPKGP
ncbi:MAG: class I SAM-dependent methyltransferase [Deltaproteobacteria bacterium]|jgi:tRNA (cmo5U34)-methyltransferase